MVLIRTAGAALSRKHRWLLARPDIYNADAGHVVAADGQSGIQRRYLAEIDGYLVRPDPLEAFGPDGLTTAGRRRLALDIAATLKLLLNPAGAERQVAVPVTVR